MRKKKLGKVQHQLIAGPTQAAVPGVTKDVAIAVFTFVTFFSYPMPRVREVKLYFETIQ